MVAGAVALIQSVNPDLNAAEIKQLLVDTARAGVAAADGSDTSKLIPATVGGGILRVDDAVLAAINLRRAAQSPPLPALVREDMLAQVSFSVDSSQTAGDGFTVTASVETAPNPATLSFDFFSEGVVSGASSQTVGMGETAEWGVTTARPGEITSGKVCRVEAARCCVITLEPVSLAGSYEGALTIGKVEATGDITIDGPDGPQEVSREECESMHAEVVGQSLTMSIELVDGGSGASGPVIGVLVGVDGETTPLGPSSWSAAGTSVSMELAVDSDGYGGGFVLQGTATPATTGSAISGTWSLVGIENLVFSGDFAFVSAS
jgi:hypothetical protein